MKRKGIIILLTILGVGLFLRLYNLHDNVFYGYDQARDAKRIFEMLFLHRPKLVGPETDIPGVFNGPLLYYFLLPFYAVSHFNPNFGAVAMTLLNLTGVIWLYLIGKNLFNSKVGLAAAFVWAVSYEQVNFARYLSNTGMTPTLCLIFFLGLIMYRFGKKEIGLPISVVGLALAIHVNFYLIYLAIFYFIYWPKVKAKVWLQSMIAGLLILLPFILAEIKFRFMASRSLLLYFHEQRLPLLISTSFKNYLQSLGDMIYYSLFSFSSFLGFLLFFFTLFLMYREVGKRDKDKALFIVIWFFSTLPLFAFQSGVVTGYSIQSSIMGAAAVIVGWFIVHCYEQKNSRLLAVISLVLIFAGNLVLFNSEKFKSIKLFAYQPMVYGEQKALMDYTYRSAGGRPFSVCALTNPLFINATWSSLYKFYGEKKYGYLPFWSGQKQYFIEGFLPYDTAHVKTRYLIIEPLAGLTKTAKETLIFDEDHRSAIVEEKYFGQIKVEKREMSPDGSNLRDTQNLTDEKVRLYQKVQQNDPRYTCFTGY